MQTAHAHHTRDVETLGESIAAMAAQIDAATHGLLTSIRAFDQVDGWQLQGARSLAHWLSWRVGVSLGVAREKVRVARALATLPRIDAALAVGRLSYSKVRAITRVATAETEELLVEMAYASTTSQLETICKLYRQTQTLDAAAAAAREAERYMTSRTTDDGMVRITIQLPPDEAALVMQAAESASETGHLADGVVSLAEAELRGASPRRTPIDVMVHVDAFHLNGTTAAGDGLSRQTCERLLCDAGIVPVLDDETGRTLDVGRKSRTVPAAIKRALAMRDGCCQFPGCTNTKWIDAHHIHSWLDGGETAVDNLVLLCSFHHRAVHERGFGVASGPGGAPEFSDRDGQPIRPAPRPSPVTTPMSRVDGVSAEINAPQWDGMPVDYDAAVLALATNAATEPLGRQTQAIR